MEEVTATIEVICCHDAGFSYEYTYHVKMVIVCRFIGMLGDERGKCYVRARCGVARLLQTMPEAPCVQHAAQNGGSSGW